MDISEFRAVQHRLPERITFPYYAGREDAWLMAQHLRDDTAVADWRGSGFGKLLGRPLIRPVLAGCGGRLRVRDFHALAYAGQGVDWSGLSPATRDQLDVIYARPWQDFELSFARWGDPDDSWFQQTSRPGYNLVVQLGFPAEHAALMGRYLARQSRKDFEFDSHPVRTEGRPTLAWARLDVDLATGTVLIEEIQSDWLRFVRETVVVLDARNPQSHHARATAIYERELRRLCGKIWPRVMMFAVLEIVRDYFGRCDVFYHQPDAGAVLKQIHGGRPPVSLYTALPKALCFAPTRAAPGFLERPNRRDLARLRRRGKDPLFWHMSF